MDDGVIDEGGAIAIVGMAGRFPGAENISELWDNLCNGVESIRRLTASELTASGVSDETQREKNFVNAGAPLNDADCFDAGFFGYLPREAELMDPQHRIFLENAWAALEDAGYDPQQYAGDIGIYGGVARNTYFLHNARVYSDLMKSGATYDVTLGSDKDYSTTRVAYQLNLNGPAMSIQTACSSSGVAVHVACQALLNGECDMAIAGGARVQVPLTAGYLWVEGGIPSPDGHCRPFDKEANGTVYGSGVASVVLKRLEDAISDRDHVYSVIRGSAINNDGSDKVGFTAPSVRGQTSVIESALGMADVNPDSIGYVETHGTGTALGDPIEIAALTKAYRRHTDRKAYCAIGSLKSNIGHLDAGAGVAGLIKASLMLHHEKLVPSLHFEQANPQIDFDNSPFFVSTQTQAWLANGTPRRAAVSAFGLGGTNFHAILEEAPPRSSSNSSNNWTLLTQSAKTASALNTVSSNLANHLENNTPGNINDLAYTLAIGRAAMMHRRVTVAWDANDAIDALRSPNSSRTVSGEANSAPQGIVFLFSGQGTQYSGMASDLYENEAQFSATVDECCSLLKGLLGDDLKATMFATSGDTERLNETRITQPALFVIEYALAKLWLANGVEPTAMVGHSIGELVAACLAGVFTLEDALRAVVARGELMQGMNPGDMLAVNMAENELLSRLPEGVEIAVVNTPSTCVVSGSFESIAAFVEQLEDEDIQSTVLNTSHAFHSCSMEPVLQPFEKVLANIRLSPPAIPLVSNVTGDWLTAEQATDPGYWSKQIRSTVRMADCIETVLTDSSLALIEVGPGHSLCTFVRQHPARQKNHVVVQSVRHPGNEDNDVAVFQLALGRLWCAGFQLRWHRLLWQDGCNRVSAPTYPFERRRYWLQPTSAEIEVPVAVAPVFEKGGRDEAQDGGPGSADLNQSRYEIISDELCDVLEELSGIPKDELDVNASFVEMGFDSLFLTRANAEFKKLCGVNIGFRQLFDEAQSVSALAKFVDEELPDDAERFQPKIVLRSHSDSDSGVGGGDTSTLADVLSVTTKLLSDGAASGDGRAGIIAHQLEIIRLQTALMRSVEAADALDTELPGNGIDARLSEFAADFEEWEQHAVSELGIVSLDAYPGVQYKLDALCSSLALRYFRESNLNLSVGATFSVDRLKGALGVLPDFDRFFTVMLSQLRDDDLVKTDRDEGVVLSRAAEYEHADKMAANIASLYPQFSGLVDLLLHCAANYRAALCGDIHAISVLLPDGRRDFVKQKLTTETIEYRRLRIYQTVLADFIVSLAQNRSLRILEVGAGGGDLTWEIASRIRDLDCSYHYTDIASVFVVDAEKKARREGWDFVRCDNLDISLDPMCQGFTRGAYDLVLGLNVIHAAPDVTQSLQHLKDLLAPGGMLCAIELIRPTRWEHMIWGLAKGWWVFGDEYREDQPLLSMEKWRDVFAALDLAECLTLPLDASENQQQDSGLLIAQKEISPVDQETGENAQPETTSRFMPLSDGQAEIWLLAMLGDNANRCFTLTNILSLEGSLDVDLLSRSIQKLIDRHESLRTQVSPDGDGQTILPHVCANVLTHDFTELSAHQTDARLQRIYEESAATAFDLGSAPLFRPQIITLDADKHIVVLTVHHIICDGWSTGVMMRDLGMLYHIEKHGLPGLPAPEHQHSNFIAVSRSDEFEKEMKRAQDYWLGQFDSELPVVSLPSDRAHSTTRTYDAGRVEVTLDSNTIANIRELGKANGSTLFNTLLSIYVVFLSRLSRQDRLIVGVSAAQQPAMGMPELISHCVSMLPLQFKLDRTLRFSELLKLTKDVVLDGFDNQACSYGRLIPHLKFDRSSGRPPLVSTVFNLDPSMLDIEFDDLQVYTSSAPRQFETFELFFTVVETSDGARIECTFNSGLFDEETIKSYLSSYDELMRSVCNNVDARIGELNLTTESDLAVVAAANDTSRSIGRDSLVHLISEHADPSNVAIEFSGVTTTYGELHVRSNQLASFLLGAGVQPGDLVAIHMERCDAMLVAMLAVMKAGGAYLPLDPGFPQDRLEYMLTDSGTEVLLTQSLLAGSLPGFSGRSIAVDDDAAAIAACAEDSPAIDVAADALAYVLYTSGSTGRPKGVMVERRCVSNFLESMAQEPGLSAADTLLAVTTTSFDISVLELFLPLSVGARVLIASGEDAADSARLKSLLVSSQATVMQATPTTWRMLLEAGWTGGDTFRALCGGEPMPQDLARDLLPVCAQVWNLYGPTETTIWSSCAQITDAAAAITIGRPIANTMMYVLDEEQNLQPIGVPGELCIGGAGVSRGYLHQAELTASVFVANPFSEEPGARMYRSGDLARWRSDGTLQHLGRIDGQVKIRGFRIELGEIEAMLMEHDSVKSAACTVWHAAQNDQRLVAYIVTANAKAIVPTELRKYLRGKVPDYMVPQHFEAIDAVPRTANRKINRQALPNVVTASRVESYEPPSTPAEEVIAKIWQNVIGIDRVGRHDFFFDIGGHSLLAIRAAAEMEDQLGKRPPLRAIILEDLSRIAAEYEFGNESPLPKAHKISSFLQRLIGR